MAPSLSKKRKADDLTAEPAADNMIKFISPGLKADVRLKVFQHEIHVHSLILKLNSSYFRRFLDSPDKTGEPASPLS